MRPELVRIVQHARMIWGQIGSALALMGYNYDT